MADGHELRRPPTGVLGYPARVQFVARSSTAVVALQSVLVFPEGCLLTFVIAVRRGSLDDPSWDTFCETLHEGDSDNKFSERDLTFRVLLPGEARVETTQRTGSSTTDSRELPVLTEVSSEFASDDQGLNGQRSLWLQPLPPAAPLELEIEWQQMGLEPTSTVLDGDAIVRAADNVTWLWP